MNKSSKNQFDKKYFIRSKGEGEMKIYYLIHHITFDSIDMFFQTALDAEKYAHQYNIEIVEYDEII